MLKSEKVSKCFVQDCMSKKIRRNDINFLLIEIVLNKVRRNHVHFSPIEITSNKVRQNDIHFLSIKITSKKVRRNYVNFSPIKITSKKYVDMTWKFVDIFSSTHRRKIAIESTSIRRGVFVGKYLRKI